MKNLKIGSHVKMGAPLYFEGSVKEMLSYDANALMIYTGAPQNTIRKETELLKIKEGLELLKENNIPSENIIVHAPYIINLCSSNMKTRLLAVEFLEKELIRTNEFKAKILVLHPGSSLEQSPEEGIEQIIFGLNSVLNKVNNDVVICLETMAGKGSEVGRTFEQLKKIIDGVKDKNRIGVCLDTCHIHDAGYDLNDFNNVLDSFDSIIGLDYLKVMHINDSKNQRGARKDRHENLGHGHIGFDNLINVIYHPKLENIVKILETPWVVDNDDKSFPIYKEEIEMIRNKKFVDYIKIIKDGHYKK